MVSPWQSSEIGDSFADLLGSNMSLSICTGSIQESRPDRDWNFGDLTQINESGVNGAIHVVSSILLEALLDNILSPMHIGLQTDWFTTGTARSIITDALVEILANGVQILVPVGSSKGIDTVLAKVEETVSVEPVALGDIDGARIDSGEGEEVVSEEILLLGESVEHLDGSLRNTHITDLLSSALLDELDIRYIIVKTHLCPTKGPVLWCVKSQRLMLLAVLCASVAGHVDIETAVEQSER